MVQWWEHKPLISVAQVWIFELMTCMLRVSFVLVVLAPKVSHQGLVVSFHSSILSVKFQKLWRPYLTLCCGKLLAFSDETSSFNRLSQFFHNGWVKIVSPRMGPPPSPQGNDFDECIVQVHCVGLIHKMERNSVVVRVIVLFVKVQGIWKHITMVHTCLPCMLPLGFTGHKEHLKMKNIGFHQQKEVF